MRRLATLGSIGIALLGCRQPNPDWLGPANDEAGDVGVTSAGSGDATGDATTGDSGSDTTEPPTSMCDTPLGTTNGGPCPDQCDGCQGGSCRISCTGVAACTASTIACAAGRPCEVTCEGLGACEAAVIECPPDTDCTVICRGEDSCQDARIACGPGPCSLECGGEPAACTDTIFECGAATGSVLCGAPDDVELVPSAGSACGCAAQGCDA